MITLKAILEAKERRWQSLNAMLAKHQCTVLSVSLNMPGQEKDSPRARKIFQQALTQINRAFTVAESVAVYEQTGPHALFCVLEPPEQAKDMALLLEDAQQYTRLWDIDVYDREGTALSHPSRSLGRKCFLCEKPSFVCMREKNHSPDEIFAKVNDLFVDFYACRTNDICEQARRLAAIALEAVLYELACTPVPGLVCPGSSGSHKDMDYFTFLSSSAALSHHLARFAQAGLLHEGSEQQLLPVLRKIGLQCEQAMFVATRGVNTQKGLIFSLGLVLGASGLLLARGKTLSGENICLYVSKICTDLVKNDLLYKYMPPEVKTAGETAYDQHFIEGVRGEAQQGFPSVLKTGLPFLRQRQTSCPDTNKNLVATLFALMQEVNDTTIIKRGQNLKALDWVKGIAKKHLESEFYQQENWQEQVEAIGREFVRQNLSPGGSADLLAVSWYLYSLEKNF